MTFVIIWARCVYVWDMLCLYRVKVGSTDVDILGWSHCWQLWIGFSNAIHDGSAWIKFHFSCRNLRLFCILQGKSQNGLHFSRKISDCFVLWKEDLRLFCILQGKFQIVLYFARKISDCFVFCKENFRLFCILQGKFQIVLNFARKISDYFVFCKEYLRLFCILQGISQIVL